MNDIIEFLFADKSITPDPLWFDVLVAGFAIGLIVIPFFGRKLLNKEKQKALHKTLKKSSALLRTFGIIFLLLLWFRLEELRFFSKKFWWMIADIFFLWFFVVKCVYYRSLKNRIRRNS
ncbi:hypothetical protein HZA38_02280 [Candidatus Peregrinibacteria bacterium]|nr:hypothetical protein [Candidatus Peregrinibacteria bacterium]